MAHFCVLLLVATTALAQPRTVAQVQRLYVVNGFQQAAERNDVDPADARERLLVFTDAGPILLELQLSIDGQPYRLGREAIVDVELKHADADGDGVATWEEALGNRQFMAGRLNYLAMIEGEQRRQLLDQLLQQLDGNQDKLVSRGEVRKAIAILTGGAAFNVSPYGMATQSGDDATRELLDVDGDGNISAEDLAVASSKLKARDVDDNDVLSLIEAGGNAGLYGRAVQLQSGQVMAVGQASVGQLWLLGPASVLEQTYAAVDQLYGAAGRTYRDGPPLWAALAAEIDANSNGMIEVDEIASLDSVAAQLQLEAAFSSDQSNGQQNSLVLRESRMGELATVCIEEDGTLLIELAGSTVRVHLSPGQGQVIDFEAQTAQWMTQFDVDKNGYLEPTEMKDNPGFASQVEAWDQDGDGKVFAEELTDFFRRQYAPLQTQINAVAIQDADPLFKALDNNADGWLGLREMLFAHEHLLTMDVNGDGQLQRTEIPEQVDVHLSHGPMQYYAYQGVQIVGGGFGVSQPAVTDGRPEWFARMDRNSDGDLSPREFLGTPEKFNQLDANSDGLLSPNEAATQ